MEGDINVYPYVRDYLKFQTANMMIKVSDKLLIYFISYSTQLIKCCGLADTLKAWDDGETTSFLVSCPTGCLEDVTFDPVYGTDIYASVRKLLCSTICLSSVFR